MREKIEDIFTAINESDLSYDEKKSVKNDVTNYLNLFSDYFTQVVRMEIFCKSVSVWGNSDEYIYSRMDEDRRIKHNLCVNACIEMNKITDALNLPDFYNGDIDDRREIAAFCGCIISTMYLDGICEERTFDELVEKFSEEDNYAPVTHIEDWEEELC